MPTNALDPTWNIDRSKPCDGKPVHHGGKWWSCDKCGYCGKYGFGHSHSAINHPYVYLMSSVLAYIAQRAKEGVGRDLSIKQMLHIAGVAIRYASTRKTEQIADYIQHIAAR